MGPVLDAVALDSLAPRSDAQDALKRVGAFGRVAGLSADPWGVLALISTVWNLHLLVPGVDHARLAAILSAAALGVAALSRSADRKVLTLLSALLLPSFLCMGFANTHLTALLPQTDDAVMSQLDHGVSAAVFGWATAHSGVARAFRMVYLGLPLGMSGVMILSPRRGRCACALALAGLFGLGLYALFPATGPAHIGDPHAPRNCMPSLHLTWSLLLLFHTPPRWRRGCALFVAATAIATLTTGEHYALDLVAAVPFSLLVFAAVNRFGQRLGCSA